MRLSPVLTALSVLSVLLNVGLLLGTFLFTQKISYLNSSYQQLESSYTFLESGYSNLLERHQQLNYSYTLLQNNFTRIQSMYDRSQDEYHKMRFSKDIPPTPSVLGLRFLLTSDALIIGYSNLSLDLGLPHSDSMHPSIPAGDTVIATHSFDRYALQIGDIVSYNSSLSSLSVVHRIIDIQRNSSSICYIIQGDNNPSPDPGCILPSQIQAKAIGILYNSDTHTYQHCSDNAGAVLNGKISCIQPVVLAGIYPVDQPTDNLSIAYSFCSDTQPNKPYSVISQAHKVYCYSSIPGIN